MDLAFTKKGLNLALKNKKWIFLALSTYTAFRVYKSPSISQKRKQISKIITLLFNLLEATSDSAEAISLISKDLSNFIRSDSDQIPNSFKQISKIANSDELNSSLIKFTQAITIGVLRGYRLDSGSGFSNRILDKLFTESGSGFASAVIGSFARNLVIAASNETQNASNANLLNAIYSNDGRKLIGDCVQTFVTTAVSVYLDKTSKTNVFDDLFAGLTNPKHEVKVKQTLVTLCNNAVETFVKTSRLDDRNEEISKSESKSTLISKVSSSLSVPSNRRYVVDLSGRVTFETVKALLEVMSERVNGKMTSYVEKAKAKSCDTKRYMKVKTSVIHSLCLSLCLQIVESPWMLSSPRF